VSRTSLVRGHEHGPGRVRRPDACLGDRDLSRDGDAAVVHPESQIRRGEDARFRHVRDEEPLAGERELAVQAPVAPPEAAVDLERPFARLARGVERE
jgi:hypothetical protein